MEAHQFYQKYASTPIEERFSLLDMSVFGMRSLHNIYQEIHGYDEVMRPYKTAQDRLLGQVQDFWIRLDALKEKNPVPSKTE